MLPANVPRSTFADASRLRASMQCDEHAALLLEYQETLDAYKTAIKKLKEHTGAIPQVEYMLLWKLADLAQKKCETARQAVWQHIVDHDC